MNRIVRIFSYEFYIKELLVLFFTFLMMENIFSWLILPDSVILLTYEKIMSLAIFAYVLYKLNPWTNTGIFLNNLLCSASCFR
jgi:hypothetical protein